jgi:hypothetical protein
MLRRMEGIYKCLLFAFNCSDLRPVQPNDEYHFDNASDYHDSGLWLGLWGFDFTLRLKFSLVEGLVESIYQSGLHSAECLIFCLIETET